MLYGLGSLGSLSFGTVEVYEISNHNSRAGAH